MVKLLMATPLDLFCSPGPPTMQHGSPTSLGTVWIMLCHGCAKTSWHISLGSRIADSNHFMPLCHTLRSITLFHFISSKIWWSESCGAQVFITAAPLGGRPSAEGLMELCAALRMFPRCREGWVVNRKGAFGTLKWFRDIWYFQMFRKAGWIGNKETWKTKH